MVWLETHRQEFLESKNDPEKFKVFVNTVLGEMEERGGDEDESILLDRREEYKADLPRSLAFNTGGRPPR